MTVCRWRSAERPPGTVYHFLLPDDGMANYRRERRLFVLGNPPWVKVVCEEGGVLGDRNALFVLRSHSAMEITLRLISICYA